MAIRLLQTPPISAGATELGAIDVTKHLDGSETLTGTPTAVEVETDAEGLTVAVEDGDLVLSDVAVSAAAMRIRQASVAAGRAVSFRVSGQQQGSDYVVLITVQTTAGRTLAFEAPFRCV